MGETISEIESRIYLNTTKFHFSQMNKYLQNRDSFLYSLMAFIPLARSITFVFKKQFAHDEKIMNWYQIKVEGWENNKIMRLFNEMRNISLKEHRPKMTTTSNITLTEEPLLFAEKITIEKVSPDGTIERRETIESPQPSKKEIAFPLPTSVVINYSFNDLPEWLDEDPDVMNLSKRYLDELEKFVSEAENLIKLKGIN